MTYIVIDTTDKQSQSFLQCHIQNDWLTIWAKYEDTKEILLTRTGTHSDLF
jgi:mRNA-degrading endonuclease YafQ of YafQ-DinJ toxin-antitoxin module